MLAAALIAATGCTPTPTDPAPTPSPPPTITIPQAPTLNPPSELSTPLDLRTDCAQLSSGDQGGCVKTLQRLLNTRGAHLPDNGVFGEHTLDRVRQFQSARGLPVTGIVTDSTKTALYDFPPAGVDLDLRTDCVDLNQGAQGRCTLSLKHLLIQFRYGTQLQGTETYGPRTAEAVRQFQHDHGLPTTGATHSLTKQALYDNLTNLTPPAPNTVDSCPGSGCSVYLGRTTTANLANAFDNHAIITELATAIVSQLACARLKATGFRMICEKTIQLTATAVITLFRQARDNHTCIQVNFQPTNHGLKPTRLTPTNGAHCPN